MNNKIIKLYCDNVIKPLEMRKKELEKEIKNHFFVSKIKKKELKMVSNLFYEKLRYLAKMIDEDEKNS